VPPEVVKTLADMEVSWPMDDEARQRQLNFLTLQHWYADQYVAARFTPHGVEVLGVGDEEAATLLRNLSLEDQRELRVGVV
jgi:hypothetical protein